jgi:4-hydroxy-tetrahydrodipicolinate reductase
MTNVVICGANGMMGKTVANCISKRDNCKVVAGIDINTTQYSDFPIYSSPKDLSESPDVIIDYSNPNTLDDVLEYCLVTGTAVVLATTGYSDEQIAKIKKTSEQIPVFFTFNMSLGINLMVELAKKAALVLGDRFDIEIIEKHHNLKIDAPSGTALMLANAINEVYDNSLQFIYDRHSHRKKRDKKEIGIHAVRGGTIVGEHEVIFAGSDEVITISHSAASKTVFAEGSINAAIFLKGKQAGLYDMSNLV